jgi:Tfp pilus assembly protein PilX
MTGALVRRRARPSGSDEQGSIILVLILIMFMTIVLLTAMAGAFGALHLSSSSTSRNDTLQAATAGVQAAVSDIRSASSGAYVAPTQLPCTAVSGVTNGAGTPSYSANIQYYAENVSGSYDAVTCSQGSGPQVTVQGDYLSRAVITSCAPAGNCPSSGNQTGTGIWRRVVSSYTFQTTNANIAGGVIFSYQDQECLVAVLQNPQQPTAGVNLDVTNSCTAGNSMATMEQFQYTSTWNLAINIANTVYCIQDPEDLASPQSSPVVLVACSGNTTNPADQWGINDNAGIQGVATVGTPSGKPNSWCLYNPMGGSSLANGTVQAATVVSCSSTSGFDPKWSWQLSPSVGAGGASPVGTSLIGSTAQVVNYQQFGLCLDVTNQDVNYAYLIDYDCKQFPDTTDYPVWNQRWCFQMLSNVNGNPQGLLFTPDGQTTCTNATNPYCAVSPQTKASGNYAAWVTVSSCSLTGTPPANELWTAWGSNGGAINDYTWTDDWGSCMEANPNDTQNPGGDTNWATIQVDTCDGSYAQKWDAPPTLGQSQISNTHEGTGTNWIIGP